MHVKTCDRSIFNLLITLRFFLLKDINFHNERTPRDSRMLLITKRGSVEDMRNQLRRIVDS